LPGPLQRRVLEEDGALEPLQLGVGLDTELLAQRPPERLVAAQRLRLPAGAIQGEHQLAREALSDGVLGGERFELSYELVVASEGQVGLDPVLDDGEPLLLQASRLLSRERLIDEICQGRSAPEGQRLR